MFDFSLPPPHLIEAGQWLLSGFAIAFVVFLLIGWVFRQTGIEKIMHRFLGHTTHIGSDPLPRALGKYVSVFIFLIFLRQAVQTAGYTEIEQFLGSIVEYLPHLLLALLITFFGIQMSRTSHTVVYKAVHFENPRTAVILAYTARVLVLFFTFTIAINQINTGTVEIIPEYLIRSILIGIVAAASLAFGLAFGLGGRQAASEFIQDHLEEEEKHEKNLKK